MTSRARVVTDADVSLLRALARAGSVSAASRSLGISRDIAVYRLARLATAFGGPLSTSERGGRQFGGTRLTALGDRVVRRGFDAVELLDSRPLAAPPRSNLLQGVYRRSPSPTVTVPGGTTFRVAFSAEEGERVTVLLDPEAILVARRKFPSSARNVVRSTIVRTRPGKGPTGASLTAHVASLRLRVAVTDEAVRQLRLAPGVTVWLYVKATAIRRVGRRLGARPVRVRSSSQ